MFKCKELNKSFQTKELMFAALKANKRELIDLKKSTIKTSDPAVYFLKGDEAEKGNSKRELAYGDYIYPVINTINYFDSHRDVHLTGIWDKSAKEQSGKTYYIVNHDLAIGSVISYPKEVEIMVKRMTWEELGRKGNEVTEALIYKAKITEKSNRDFFLAAKAGEEIQNSVRMLYISMELAVNSKSPDFLEEKAFYDKTYPLIYNKKDVDEVGYFWGISEAKIYKEGSAVLFGSNDVTPVMYDEPKNIEPDNSTQNTAAKRTVVRTELNKLLKTFKS